ncbi:MAG: penicillin-binding transpeptidase domain-containing protein [Eubacterium sp.]
MSVPKNSNNRRVKHVRESRITWALIILSFCLVLLFGKLIYLQVFDSTDQYARQVDQLVEEVPLKASRGNIFDRNMNVLVQDSTASAIHVIPLEVEDPGKLADELVEKLKLDRNSVMEKINKIEDDNVEIKRGMNKNDADEIIATVPEGISYENKTLYVIPDKIKDAHAAAEVISNKLKIEYDVAYKILTRKENSTVLIEGKVDNQLAKKIATDQEIKDNKGNVTGSNGVEIIEDKRRYYTNGNFASYVLGFTGQDHRGLQGIESVYDEKLRGEDGVVYFQKDANGNQIPSQTHIVKQPKQGINLVTTIDSNIQILAEKNLTTAVQQWKAKSGTAIVMDTKTGEVVAMATKPDYNLNEPYTIGESYNSTHGAELSGKTKTDQLNEMWKNPAVSFIYEPGSTFKAITAASALEEGVVTPETTVYCNGAINVSGVTIKCTGNHGTQTVSEAIANSCNPGLVQIIQKLEPNLFYQYVYNFGLGKKTGIELTGEEPGLVNRIFNEKGEVNAVDYATFSFGQGLATTPIQMISALNGVVNNGYYMNPTLVAKNSAQQEFINGKLNSPKQLISKDTSSEMRKIMEHVVTESPSLLALADGDSIGGKTGTAEKFVDGAYSNTLYVTSFFCYAPVDDPKYSILVVLDEPDPSAFGGTSAAPVAIGLMKQVLNYMGGKNDTTTEIQQGTVTIPDLLGQNKDFATTILDEKGIKYKFETKGEGNEILAQSIPARSAYDPNTELVLEVGTRTDVANTSMTVPDLSGMSIQSVNEMVSGLGLNLKVNGSGFATEQSPVAGTVVEKGSEISVTFKQ